MLTTITAVTLRYSFTRSLSCQKSWPRSSVTLKVRRRRGDVFKALEGGKKNLSTENSTSSKTRLQIKRGGHLHINKSWGGSLLLDLPCEKGHPSGWKERTFDGKSKPHEEIRTSGRASIIALLVYDHTFYFLQYLKDECIINYKYTSIF